jgi:protein gp37
VRDLQQTEGPRVKWISVEPLLGRMNDMPLEDIDWVVVGGESHCCPSKARKMKEWWVRELRDRCLELDIAFHLKQMGSQWAMKNNSQDTKGGDIDEFPDDLKIRQFPAGYVPASRDA